MIQTLSIAMNSSCALGFHGVLALSVEEIIREPMECDQIVNVECIWPFIDYMSTKDL